MFIIRISKDAPDAKGKGITLHFAQVDGTGFKSLCSVTLGYEDLKNKLELLRQLGYLVDQLGRPGALQMELLQAPALAKDPKEEKA